MLYAAGGFGAGTTGGGMFGSALGASTAAGGGVFGAGAAAKPTLQVSIRQHTSAYVSIRQHTFRGCS